MTFFINNILENVVISRKIDTLEAYLVMPVKYITVKCRLNSHSFSIPILPSLYQILAAIFYYLKVYSYYFLSAAFIYAGYNHFAHPETFLKIMPPWLGHQLALIYFSGAVEIIAGAGLILKNTRKISSWVLILLLVAVFPANVQMSINYAKEHHPYFWLTILRLPLQPLLIYWLYGFTKNIQSPGSLPINKAGE